MVFLAIRDGPLAFIFTFFTNTIKALNAIHYNIYLHAKITFIKPQNLITLNYYN
jgi:hypothetical protein